jgi:hypothetical protein
VIYLLPTASTTVCSSDHTPAESANSGAALAHVHVWQQYVEATVCLEAHHVQ